MRISLSLALLLLLPQLAWSLDAKVSVVRQSGSSPRIGDLNWLSEQKDAEIIASRERLDLAVTLEGRFTREGWSLVYGARKLELSSSRTFALRIPISGREGLLSIAAVGPRGEVETEDFLLICQDWDTVHHQWKDQIHWRSRITPGIAFSSMIYQQTGFADAAETALTAKVSYQYRLIPDRWNLGASAFVTALPLSHSGGSSFRFFGMNARIGYSRPLRDSSWQIGIMGGLYSVTMIVPQRSFGFRNMAGPQLYPMIQKTFANEGAASAYFKISPVSNRFLSALSLSNREIAGGGAYHCALRNGHLLSATVDIADIGLSIDGVRSHARSISAGLGYSL